MTAPHQRFRQGHRAELLAVRKDKTTGELYSRVTDIQRSFPGVSLFKVNGVIINFLEDEDEQMYEPHRIAHYPDDVVDIVTTYPSSSLNISTDAHEFHHLAQLSADDRMTITLSKLSIQPSLTSSSDTLVPPLNHHRAVAISSASSSTTNLFQSTPIARPLAVLSSIASEISQIQSKLDRSTDDQSVQHIQLMQQLFQMVQRQNETLTQLAESKEREERVLAELAEAKERDEEMHRIQRQTIDRLIIAQQRIDTILVQNYELHEYPIPRLFVILPGTLERWDPRNLFMERFRLFFLCECGDDCGTGSNYSNIHGSTRSQLSISSSISTSQYIPVKNTIHLARHDGYELSRPTEFFNRYGPYVLGMLRILKHCLAVAAVAAPAVGIAESSVKEVMDGVKSMSESTREAVDVSINFLEHKLDDNKAEEDLVRDVGVGQEENDLFENLAALEGADLRRLDTFLRNNDKDKILGNLYRITTEQGHVKWVCLEHYKEAYSHTTLASFVQSIEAAGGAYDRHFRKVTISLTSSTLTKDFFKRLVKQASAVDELDVSLDWKFGSADLVLIVDMLSRSNIKSFNLDLKDVESGNATIAALRPGKGRYHSLLGLLFNTKLRSLSLNLLHLGSRTSDLPSQHRPSLLQSFHFVQKIASDDNPRLANIIHHCPGLVDLRLGSSCNNNKLDTLLHRTICSLTKLQVLHLYRLDYLGTSDDELLKSNSCQSLKDIVCTAFTHTPIYIKKAVQESASKVEVLMLRDMVIGDRGMDFVSTLLEKASIDSSERQDRTTMYDSLPGGSTFTKLSHLSLSTKLSDSAIDLLASVLPALNLVHFGVGRYTRELLPHVRIESLRSLAVSLMHQDDAPSFIAHFLYNQNFKSRTLQMDSLMIECSYPIHVDLQELLAHLPLRRLFLSIKDVTLVDTILKTLDFSRLETLSIFCKEYDWDTEDILAWRCNKFLESLKVEIGYSMYWEHSDIFVDAF
ncbi:hypothetical protein EC991_001074 [Linnemannia zychae]|nr:hypothetical protein EC991_001074 [Linnemannia zychae]